MTHASLFSGIGGFDLAAQWMGWRNVFAVEINPFCRKVLSHHFPNTNIYEDIKTFDATPYAGTVDVLTGGFPCQPYSIAGQRLGKADERHLFPEMLRVVKELKPTWVVGENVRGLLNWNGGMVFDEVCADLESAGYEVLTFVIPAVGINAPHKRERVWFVAKNTKCDGRIRGEFGEERTEIRQQRDIGTGDSDRVCVSERHPPHAARGRRGGWGDQECGIREWQFSSDEQTGSSVGGEVEGRGGEWAIANTTGTPTGKALQAGRQELDECGVGEQDAPNSRLFGQEIGEKQATRIEQCNKGFADNTDSIGLASKEEDSKMGRERPTFSNKRDGGQWQNFPTESPVRGGDDGIPTELDGITIPRWCKESIHAYGNAVVPQVVYQIFKAIEAVA